VTVLIYSALETKRNLEDKIEDFEQDLEDELTGLLPDSLLNTNCE
jgi:hypothetical protein